MNQQHRNFMSALGPSAVNPAARAMLHGNTDQSGGGGGATLPNVDPSGSMYPGYPGSGESEGLSPWAKQMLAQLGYTEEQIMQWASVFGPPSPYAEPSNPEYLIQMLVDKEMIIGEDGRLCHTDGQGNVRECYGSPTTDPGDPGDPDPGDPDPGDPDPPTKCGDWPKEIEGPNGVMVLDESTCSYGPKGGWDPGEPGEPGGNLSMSVRIGQKKYPVPIIQSWFLTLIHVLTGLKECLTTTQTQDRVVATQSDLSLVKAVVECFRTP